MCELHPHHHFLLLRQVFNILLHAPQKNGPQFCLQCCQLLHNNVHNTRCQPSNTNLLDQLVKVLRDLGQNTLAAEQASVQLHVDAVTEQPDPSSLALFVTAAS